MDKTDSVILTLLKENSRMSNSQIAEAVHLSVPAVSERIRKLREKGYIKKFTVYLNREKTGQALLAFILVNLSGAKEKFLQLIKEDKTVLECHHVAGEYDYLLKAAVNSTTELEHFVSVLLKSNAGVSRTNTIIVLSTLREEL